MLGQIDKMPVPGKVEFVRDGKTYTLLPVLEEPDAKELWYIFADKTSAKETYGGGRFLYSDMPKDGKVVDRFQQVVQPAVRVHAACDVSARTAGKSPADSGDGRREEISRRARVDFFPLSRLRERVG